MVQLIHLSEIERDCVLRYVSLLVERLGANLVRVYLFGSAARGDQFEAPEERHRWFVEQVRAEGRVIVEHVGRGTEP